MELKNSLYGCLAIILLARLLSVWRKSCQRNTPGELIAQARRVVTFEAFGPEAAADLASRLALRSRANKRIAEVFQIDNAFTTRDTKTYNNFVRVAKRFLQGLHGNGEAFLECSILGTRILDHEELWPDASVSLQRVVRVLSFHVVMHFLHPFLAAGLFCDTGDQGNLIDAADHATDLINSLWMKSKTMHTELPQEKRRRLCWDVIQLRFRISRWLMASREPKGTVTVEFHDMLAVTLPIYETLWRVVLLTYVHVAFRYIDDTTQGYVDRLVEDVQNGTLSTLSPSSKRFCQEALRLYPPTKRIYRESETCRLQADVEALHHDKRTWGADTMAFQPDRFLALSPEQSNSYMPFGLGKHKCPAADGSAYKFIAYLVVALLKEVGTGKGGAKLVFGDKALDSDLREPLPTGRDDARKWEITKARPSN